MKIRSRAVWVVVGLLLIGGIPNLRAQSQAEMNIEAGEELNKADTRLNVVYQKLLKKNADDPKFCSDLKEAQRAWLRFVDFHLKTVFPVQEGETQRTTYGSIFPVLFASEKQGLILQRVKQLEYLLDNKLESEIE